MSDPMTTATAEMFLRRAEAAEAERDRLREALDDLCDRQHDYPTDLSKNSAWYQAFDDARALLAGSVSDKDREPAKRADAWNWGGVDMRPSSHPRSVSDKDRT
jgi:hypothetical protein